MNFSVSFLFIGLKYRVFFVSERALPANSVYTAEDLSKVIGTLKTRISD